MPDQQSKIVIVKAPAAQCYKLWADFERFPNFMRNIQSVSKTGDRTSHWVMQGPLGKTLEWDAETVRMEENTRIAWNSTQGDIETSGQVTFLELPTGETQITFSQHLVPPAGMAGEAVANLVQDPDQTLEEILRDFKAYCEGQAKQSAA